MMDSIYKKQNEPQLLKCIAAQRKEYNEAKRIGFCKDFLAITFAVFSIIASWVDNDMMTAIAFLLAGVTSLAGKYIDIYTHKYKNTAAVIQQYIDVSLYNFVLKDQIADWGVIPTFSELAETTSTLTEKDMDGVENWYSDYSDLTPIEQVFCCQKENIRWDIRLRQEFRNFLFVIIGSAIFGLFATAISINPSIIRFLCVISWMLPLMDFYYSYWSKLQKDIKRLERLKEKCSEIEKTISKKDFNSLCFDSPEVYHVRMDLIKLQSGVLESREESTLIPTWFYKIRQKPYQISEDKIASEMKHMSSWR